MKLLVLLLVAFVALTSARPSADGNNPAQVEVDDDDDILAMLFEGYKRVETQWLRCVKIVHNLAPKLAAYYEPPYTKDYVADLLFDMCTGSNKPTPLLDATWRSKINNRPNIDYAWGSYIKNPQQRRPLNFDIPDIYPREKPQAKNKQMPQQRGPHFDEIDGSNLGIPDIYPRENPQDKNKQMPQQRGPHFDEIDKTSASFDALNQLIGEMPRDEKKQMPQQRGPQFDEIDIQHNIFDNPNIQLQ